MDDDDNPNHTNNNRNPTPTSIDNDNIRSKKNDQNPKMATRSPTNNVPNPSDTSKKRDGTNGSPGQTVLSLETTDGTGTPAHPTVQHKQSTLSTKIQQAIYVRHAFKHYGSDKNPNRVLKNLNMTVAKGTIYGLLGASGCGKTTLLSCIVGRRRLNAGEIWVLGGKPGTKGSGVPGKRVGYMPQETALFGEFSIKETMLYFGWIFEMPIKEINKRHKFLINFLDLPTRKRLVKNLSGGQQRRVSFAVALMHDPELLILDEPTVGVDPLLRQTIWNHLVQLTKDRNKTVIITTHYIEEARQAHTIGLMRGGRFLAEESPNVLLSMYNCQSLEEVFLKLSRKQQGQIEALPEVNNASLTSLDKYDATMYIPQEKSNINCHNCCTYIYTITTCGKIRALILKNFLRMWRNIGLLLFIFALPVMQVILFCLAIGRDPKGLKIAVVNQEIPYHNRSYQHCSIDYEKCPPTNLSCLYLNHLKNTTIDKEFYPDVNSALDAVRNGEAWAVLYFTKEYSDALFARMLLGTFTDDETIDLSEIKVWLDMSNQQISIILKREILLSYIDFSKDVLKPCDQNPKLGDVPILFEKPIYGETEPSFTDFVAPGVILSIVFFLAVALTSLALIIERTEGLLDRSWVAGVSPVEILFSHVITQFVVMCGQTALVLIFMILIFGIECKGNFVLTILLTILQGLCGMCFGFLISAVCELERNAIQLALGSFYPTLLLSGVIWPIEGMPVLLRYIALCLPMTMATTSLRSMLARGWSILEQDVYFGFLSTIIWIIFFLSISFLILKFKRG